MRKRLFGVLVLAAAVVATGGNLMAGDPCDNDACCVNAATCVVTDRETLEALSIERLSGGTAGRSRRVNCLGGPAEKSTCIRPRLRAVGGVALPAP